MVLKCVEKIEPFFKRRHKTIVALTVQAPVSKQEPRVSRRQQGIS